MPLSGSILRQVRVAIGCAVMCAAVVWPTQAALEVTGGANVRSSQNRLLADAFDGHLNQHDLLDAAMIAGGRCLPVTLERLTSRFQTLVQELRSTLPAGDSDAKRALAIHAFLHQHVLRQYHVDSSDVAQTLKSGDYNCVSASVLYVAVARELGIRAHAVQLPEHVRCEAIADGRTMPIEMTTASGSPRSTTKHNSRVLSDVTLLATIFFNRGVAAFDSGDLDDAIELNTIAVELDPRCQPAKENLLAAINNRVVELTKAGSISRASKLLEQGLRIAPDYRPFALNRAYLLQQSTVSDSGN